MNRTVSEPALKSLVKRAAMMREASWLPEESRYEFTVEEAVNRAAVELQLEWIAKPIYLAFEWWNDLLDWAHEQ